MKTDRITYLLPIRRAAFSEIEAAEFAAYFNALETAGCDVFVIDGSPAQVFDLHHQVWSKQALHEKVDRRFGYLNIRLMAFHRCGAIPNEKIILAETISLQGGRVRRVGERLMNSKS